MLGWLTGGFSSTSSPGRIFALRLAKTPSLLPAPMTRPVVVDSGNDGSCVDESVEALSAGRPLIALCLASSGWRSLWVFSLSSSSDGESKVSARVRSASETRRSCSEGACEGANDDVRERKDGGGEFGIAVEEMS